MAYYRLLQLLSVDCWLTLALTNPNPTSNPDPDSSLPWFSLWGTVNKLSSHSLVTSVESWITWGISCSLVYSHHIISAVNKYNNFVVVMDVKCIWSGNVLRLKCCVDKYSNTPQLNKIILYWLMWCRSCRSPGNQVCDEKDFLIYDFSLFLNPEFLISLIFN